MDKQQRSIKGLKFGDHQNLIDHHISTGVIEDIKDLTKINLNSDIMIEDENDSDSNLDDIADGDQVEIVVEDPDDPHIEEGIQNNNNDETIQDEDIDTNTNSEVVNEVAVENRHDKFTPDPEAIEEEEITRI